MSWKAYDFNSADVVLGLREQRQDGFVVERARELGGKVLLLDEADGVGAR